MSDILKLLVVFAELGEKVMYLESSIRAAGREYHYDTNGIIIKVVAVI